jgi:hypothetical protein
MTTATQQIQAATRQFVPQIYRAVLAQPTAAGRAKVLRMILVGIDPGLSERVAERVSALELEGLEPRQAIIQALADELTLHMNDLTMEIDASLDGLGTTTTTTTTRTPARIARMNAIGGMITDIGGLVNNLTQTAGNIAISARQVQTRQTVTGLPGMPQQAAPAAMLPALDPYAGMQPAAQQPPPSTTPWGLIVGGVVVVGALGGLYWYTTTKKKPAAAAA